MSRIKCKDGDKVVLYRKDPCYPHLDVGTILTIEVSDMPYPYSTYNGRQYVLKRTSLRHLRKTDAGAKVVIVQPDFYLFWHGFAVGKVVTIDGETSHFNGSEIYKAVDEDGAWQWLDTSHFKLAKEQ